ncbi:MarR family transcriptional regulator [Mucilaginibacter daejeonensis]|uniref:MarR family winged helix-turn-helix transcriptional regulator n=1 Tax=Mucilaginibacter daejeonensis TaxID=398049 RepID=UPI001D176A0E|nr:MarR family transcriptional regulator [Mucilaginibacter daejeonensis]UEG54382.1 MarR family transcriptional regulator [Mucilaginibacter daejeonensis]
MAQPTLSKADLALELGRSMAELRNILRQHIQVRLKENDINLTFEMLEVLSALWKKDGVNQQELADLTMRDKSSMTYLIDNLVKRGMVKRVEDDNDRRNKLIHMTDECMALKERLYPWVAEVYDKATHDIAAERLQSGVDLINQMVTNLNTVQ